MMKQITKVNSWKIFPCITKTVRYLLATVLTLSIYQQVHGEGSAQFRPDTTKAASIMILNGTSYGSFACYNATDTNRLFIRINNPASEKIYFGIGQRSTNTDWYFRIKDPNGSIIYGPTLLPKTAGSQGFISYYKQAIAGPSILNPQGYNAFVINPTANLSGNYYIEFNQGSGTTISTNSEIDFGIFDVTVSNSITNTPIPGRLFSLNWSFNTSSYSTPFFGSFYIYGSDSSVTLVNMNGIKPYKFRASCNSWGSTNTGNAINDRKSRIGYFVSTELKLFLQDPDHIAFPSGSMQFLNAPVSLSRCIRDSICINVNLTKKSDVTILIDRNGNGVFDPATADRKLSFPGTPQGQNCLYWDGKDGLGAYVAPGSSISAIINVENGEVNFPMYDVENHETGFSMNVIRPGAGLFVDSLYFNDNLVGGSTNLTGCAFPCHTWISNPVNTENSIGNNNTMNTYWFAHKQNVSSNIIVPDYLVTQAGPDQTICVTNPGLDTVQLSGSIAFSTSSYNGSKKWSTTGSGSFIPNDSTYNASYLPSANDISNGIVTFFLAPKNSCSTPVDTMVVSLKKRPQLSLITSNINCYGQSTASINLTVSNSNSPYQFSWNTGSTNQNLSNVSAGNYSVTVTSSQGCTSTTSAVITQPASSLAASATSTTNVSCFGGTDGTIGLIVNGGTLPYYFQWNNGATTSSIAGLQAGNYTTTITDSKGCTTVVPGIAISEPSAALDASVSSRTDVLCTGGNNGAITISISGGTMPYTFNWSNGSTIQNIGNLNAGNYSVTVIDSQGCSKVVNGITISQPSNSLTAFAGSTTQVNCYGSSTGAINLSVNGGTTPYTYLWNNGANSQDLNNISAGSYTVTVTDGHGCSFTTSGLTITQPAEPITATATTTANVSCNSGANGAIGLTVSGGSPNYSFYWSNGSWNQNISGLNAGIYAVTITDSKGCTYNTSASVNQPIGSLNSNLTVSQQILCHSGNNGSINLTCTGGTTPYTYQWSNGASTQDISNLSSGSYTVTVMDNNGCVNIATSVINQPTAALSTSISALSSVSCFGGSNGTIDLTANGGTSPYTYLWNTGIQVEDPTGLTAGNYTVTVTDANGCTLSNTAIMISQPPADLQTSISSTSNVSCFSGNNGTITLNVTGGTSPYSYNWSNGGTTALVSQLSAGSYSVVVTDANGCSKSQGGLIISQPSGPLTVAAGSITQVSCNGGNNGTINLTVNGGTAGYTYQWNTGATTQQINALNAGLYTATVTDSKGCTEITNAISVNQPPAALQTTVSGIGNVSCYGGNNATVNLNVSGGTSPYQFNWSNGSTIQNLNAAAAGSYTVTVTDANGCTKVNSGIAISQPPAALNGNVSSSVPVSCFGGDNGAINLTVTGGTAPYNYVWNDGSISQNITNLSIGSYSVTITDANNCTAVVNAITITQPPAAINLTVTGISAADCYGNSTGAINIAATGGTGPYQFNWSNGASTQQVSSLAAGSYTVTVTDTKGCQDVLNGIIVNEPAATLQSNISSLSDVSCFGGTNGQIDLIVVGGTYPYSFLWSNGATSQVLSNVVSGNYNVTITDANGCSNTIPSILVGQPANSLQGAATGVNEVNCFGDNSGAIDLTVNGGTLPYSYVWSNGTQTQDLTNIVAGAYTVTVTDGNGCIFISTAIQVSQPPAPLASQTTTTSNVSCNSGANGSITLSVSGGSPGYSFLWSNGSTTQNISSLYSGNYVVTITDMKGCTTNTTGSVSQPAGSLSSAIIVNQQVGCFGGTNGSINLIPTGGTTPYSFQWSNGETTEDISNLQAGTYSVIVIDNNGCINISSALISQPQGALSAVITTQSAVSCFGGNNGSVDLTINGGTAPYSYLWNNGSVTEDQFALPAGAYTVNITDANGCTVSNSAITISQPPAALSAVLSNSVNVSCYSQSNGSLSILPSGGTAPYTYNWSNGNSTSTISSLTAGTYEVTITDANGCITSLNNLLVTQPNDPLVLSASSISAVTCFGGTNGSISLAVYGGTASYLYQWSNGLTTQNITNLPAGSFTVTVTDTQGCTDIASGITIAQPPAALSSNVTGIGNVNCFGGNNAMINLSVAGGTSPYSFNWSNGSTLQNINNLAAGQYTVTITDSQGCNTTNSGITISQPPVALNSNVASTNAVSCYGGANGAITLSVSGGTVPYSFAWSNGSYLQNISNLSNGAYTVTVTDANNCTTSIAGIAISQPGATLQSSVNSSTPVGCFGNSTGSIILNVAGGTSPYLYAWNNGATTQNLTNIPAGSYSVNITDMNGCTNSVSGISIAQPGIGLNANLVGTTPVSCFGNNTGSLVLNVNGGTSPYVYNWSNGATSQNLNNAGSGSYSITISDQNGCTYSLSGLTISQPPAALSNTVSSNTSVSCYGGTNGSIILNTSGGTSPYSFLWSNGDLSANLVNVPSGSYAVTVTDNNGCTNSITSLLISQPPAAISGNAVTTQNVSCNSGGNGSVTLTVNGGTIPYSFLWSNSETTKNITGLYSGSYVVTVTDNNGCVYNTSASVTQPAGALSSSILVNQQVSCYGNNTGSILLPVNGGTPPYSFLWSNGLTTQNISGLAAGVYSATISDLNGCINVASANITQPVAPLAANVSNTIQVDCYGAGNGVINLNVSGGTGPYQYLWSNGQTNPNINSLAPGTYTVSITDASGCTTSIPAISITQPPVPLGGVVGSNTAVDCYGNSSGALQINVNGGTSPYFYLWSNGANTPVINNLAAGIYNATITDANGCVAYMNGITVTQPGNALNANTSTISSVSCYGGANGAINLAVTGGTSPYSYLWNTGDTLPMISNLDTGIYQVTITDLNGCSTLLGGIIITQPPVGLSGNTTILQQVDCYGGFNGVVDLTPTGGTSPYTYLWSNGDTNEDAASLSSGTFTVTVTDANGCTATATAKVGQPDTVLVANISSITNVACYGDQSGFINISVNGGTFPYSYLWSNGMTTKAISNISNGIYSVTVTDSKGCTYTLSATVIQPAAALSATTQILAQVGCYGSPTGAIDLQPSNGTPPYTFAWNNGAVTEDLNGIPAGTYTVIITDANGCTLTQVAIVQQPAGALTTSTSIIQTIDCFNNANGAIDLTVTQGTPPYTYLWNNGVTSQDLSNLNAGTYTVTVTDANGCTRIETVQLQQPIAALSAIGSATIANCLNGIGGAITLQVIGGTPPYTFNWSNGMSTQNPANLMAGTYSVTITDSKGCVTSQTIQVTDNSTFQALAQGPTDFCLGDMVTLAADSLNGVNYQWYQNGQPVQGANSFTFTTPASGSYSVTITNACGTFTSQVIPVTVHQVGQISVSPRVIICPRDGEKANLYVAGGYSYQWTPPAGLNYTNINNPVATPLQSTSYTVTITGDFGCTVSAKVEVDVACDTLVVPTGFSPNSDGINDGYTIVGIEKYPGNKIWIYNRWGNLIYKKHDYMNTWNGESNVGGVYIGKKVPPGTYFFILDLNNNTKPIQGYITLRY